MTANRASSIKNWITSMGFKLYKSHMLNSRSKKIKYYTLGSFGVYEEIRIPKNDSKKSTEERFISWTPWGVDLEITSVRDLSKAYEDFLSYNPNIIAT
ncbi:MAG TPA: hypothetical protein DIT07_14840 [Sphingobacteriaceae bacterium]|nr:hypothetical protein [Sphingobacteriaceae bacterium]